jgi:hypothetical protein
MGGMITSDTSEVMMDPKAAPMMIPTAMSRTLPLMMNFLNSSTMTKSIPWSVGSAGGPCGSSALSKTVR